MTKIKVINPGLTIDHSFDGSVSMKFRGRYDSEGGSDEVVIIMNPREVLEMSATLAQNAAYALRDVVDNLAIGPCEACGNSRLIWFIDKHDNRTNRYCECVADIKGRRGQKDVSLEHIAAATPTMADSEAVYSGNTVWEEDSDG